MDSITHVVVGATVGYLLAGKKYGKKTMIWGALGGSLPDIDVVSNLWLDPVTALMAHRGITHSILFLVIISPFLAWLNTKFYKSGYHDRRGMRFFIASFLLVLASITGLILNLLLYSFDWLWLIISLPLSIWGGIELIKIFRNYVFEPNREFNPNFKDVWLVFFVTLVTHLFLDSCTTYGTGLFEPFSNQRIALNNISVADIFFTIPASIGILLTCIRPRSFFFARVTLSWMVLYFAFSFFNFSRVEKVFQQSLNTKNIPVKKMMISPSILNNFLWYVVAESDSTFVSAQYSIFDKKDQADNFNVMPKSYQLLPSDAKSKDLNTLHAFSQGYYNLCLDKQGNVQWNDLRFGIMGEQVKDPGDYVFKFKLKNTNGSWVGHQSQEMNKTIAEIWPIYWKRVWGI